VDLASPGLDQELAKFRAYLSLLARLHIDRRLQGKLDLSGVVQQTLLEAYQAFAQLKDRSEAEKAAWLRRALANNLNDEIRKLTTDKRNVERERSLQLALEESSARIQVWLATENSAPVNGILRQEQALQLANALARLPENQRLAVELRHLKGLSVSLVAQEMGSTKPAVIGLLNRGVKKLRQFLQDDAGD
jgi:RNA polymerase sigma-70 factor (ECF subfamily)